MYTFLLSVDISALFPLHIYSAFCDLYECKRHCGNYNAQNWTAFEYKCDFFLTKNNWFFEWSFEMVNNSHHEINFGVYSKRFIISILKIPLKFFIFCDNFQMTQIQQIWFCSMAPIEFTFPLINASKIIKVSPFQCLHFFVILCSVDEQWAFKG